MADTERCIHELLPGQCALCIDVPVGLTERVYVTRAGQVFHRSPDCEALHEGHRMATARGQETHHAELVHVTQALGDGRGACIPCFPDYAPRGTKLCWVRVGHRWVAGLLTEWIRAENGWVGKVVYVAPGRIELLHELKPAQDLRKRDPDPKPGQL